MSSNQANPRAILGLLLLIAGGFWAAAACNSSDDGNPQPTVTGGTANVGTGGTGTGEGGTAGTGAVGGGSCTNAEDLNCYSCTPQKREDFLNQCPTSGCQPFDNSTLPLYTPGGSLPDYRNY